MSALPASPRIAAGEKIYRKIVALCARYNGGKDTGIVMRGWDADLKALITQKPVSYTHLTLPTKLEV